MLIHREKVEGTGARVCARRTERGAVLVEFAIALPILALVCFGMVDFARAYQLQIKLRNAAREGASFGQYYPNNATSDCSGSNGSTQYIVQRVVQADNSITIPAANVSVTDKNGAAVTCSSTFAVGDTLKVTVTGQFTLLTPLVSFVTGKTTYALTGSQTVVVQK